MSECCDCTEECCEKLEVDPNEVWFLEQVAFMMKRDPMCLERTINAIRKNKCAIQAASQNPEVGPFEFEELLVMGDNLQTLLNAIMKISPKNEMNIDDAFALADITAQESLTE